MAAVLAVVFSIVTLGNSPCPPRFSGNRQRMLTSAAVCKALGPEFRYESSTSSGANQRREWAMAKDSVVVAVPPGSEAAATSPSPLMVGVNCRGHSLWGSGWAKMCSQTISSMKNKSVNKKDSFFPLVLCLLSHLVSESQ